MSLPSWITYDHSPLEVPLHHGMSPSNGAPSAMFPETSSQQPFPLHISRHISPRAFSPISHSSTCCSLPNMSELEVLALHWWVAVLVPDEVLSLVLEPDGPSRTTNPAVPHLLPHGTPASSTTQTCPAQEVASEQHITKGYIFVSHSVLAFLMSSFFLYECRPLAVMAIHPSRCSAGDETKW